MDGGAWWAAVCGVTKSRIWLSDFTFMHWRRKWQPTPVFLPGESHKGGAWWAAIYGVTQSRTQLKRLSSSRQHIKRQRHYFANKIHLDKAMVFPVVMYGCESWTIKLSTELMLLNCSVREDSWEFLGQQGDPTIHPKGNQSWIFIGRTNVEAETPILLPSDSKNWLIGKDWCWERLKAGGEGDDRGWDDWIASLTQRTRVWVNSGSWWWTGRPGILQSMGSQRVGHNWVTELNFPLNWGIVRLDAEKP